MLSALAKKRLLPQRGQPVGRFNNSAASGRDCFLIDFACAGNPRGRRPEGSIALLPSGLPSALDSAASGGDFSI